MTRTPTAPAGPDERGMSMIELIIAASIAALLLGLMASLFVTGLRTEAATRDRDRATGQAQVVTDSIQTSIRNAADINVTDDLLVARVIVGDGVSECRAWALTPSGDLAYTASDVPIGTDPSAWTVLAGSVSGGLDGGAAFRAGDTDSRTVEVELIVRAGDAVVPVSAAAVTVVPEDGVDEVCL
ncbi:hypothetical protein M4I32_10015 [Microbacterium sp. LRZ72]|uniref:PilW family protein n=1 Tax=Microbacterium sp. LRZ72 TaxID=2942481 RepID=UPI0029A67545|nr:hypothetical protein [Microbacterium sp. LRZ72]MDX2377133.1 hypothetical protein [Microbacterium sp. LRZ72]